MSTKTKAKIGKIIEKVEEILVENNEDTEKIVDDDVWTAVQSFVDENGFNGSQIKHYNLFIYEMVQQIVDHFRKVVIEENGKTYILEFGEVFFKPPYFVENDESGDKLYPTEALQRNITYASAIHGDITITPPSGEPSLYEKHPLGYMPVMILSDLCNLTAIMNDPVKLGKHNENFMETGGYFVVAPKGENATGATAQRRVLSSQERSSTNRVQVFTTRRKANPKFNKYAEVRSTGNGMHTTVTTIGIIGKRIGVVLPWIDATEIPLGLLFYALGVTTEKEISTLILGPNYGEDVLGLKFLITTLEYSYECNTQESALWHIGKKARKFEKDDDLDVDDNDDDLDIDNDAEDEVVLLEVKEKKKKAVSEDKMKTDAISYATKLLTTEFFPHVSPTTDGKPEEIQKVLFAEKAKYLGYMCQKLLWVILERRNAECRDHYMNKRISTPSTLLSQQFYGAFRRLITEITNNTRKALKTGNNVNILSWIKPSIITNAMNGAISGNNWSSGGPTSKGISQLYEEFNHASCIANMRKLTVPMAQEGGKVIEPRDLHGSHFGIVCVTGDTMVLMADGTTWNRIDQLEGKDIMTIDPVTLKHEPSSIFNPIKIISEKLLEIQDSNGNKIKCTPDHPFLIVDTLIVIAKILNFTLDQSNFIWKKAGDLKIGDVLIKYTDCEPFVKTNKTRFLTFVENIKEIENEYVYDFTTTSKNHSFVANGFVTHNCPSETPEGKKAGLVKNMAFTSLVTIGSDPEPIKKIVKTILGTRAKRHYPDSLLWAKVFVNGSPVGETETPDNLTKELVRARRAGKINAETSIAYFKEYNEVQISTDSGRLCRPLFIVNDGEMPFRVEEVKKLVYGELTWTQLLSTGMVELVDKAEEENYVIAGFPSELEALALSEDQIKKKFLSEITHCEMHPSLMYGIGGSIIPFPDHNQCIYQEELVLMADGTKKKIKDVEIGDEVLNFDPKTGIISKTTVISTVTKETTKQMWQIETINGTIIATYDHRFICPEGWRTVKNLDIGDYIGVYKQSFHSRNIIEPIFRIQIGDLYFVQIITKNPVNHKLISDITTDSSNQSFFVGNGFGVHNSPRNCYQASMGKQAVGVPFTNYMQIMSGSFHTMEYLQKPLCLSRAGSIVRFDEMPAGQNAIIAVMPRPYNEEDSIEMCKDSVEAGFMVSYKWTCYYSEIREEKKERFGIPTEDLCDKMKGRVVGLTEEGFPKSGTVLKAGDIIIGKLVENTISEDAIKNLLSKKKKYSDSSLIYDHAWPSTVSRIQVGTTGDGYPYIRVMLCQRREPIVGDKFCYSPDHEILTTIGWIPVANIKKKHQVASLNPKTGKLEYQNPTEVVEFDYDSRKDGNMILVETNQVNLCVTPNHKMYVKRRGRKDYKLENAEELSDIHVHYKKNAEWKVKGLSEFILPMFWYDTRKTFQGTKPIYDVDLYLQRKLEIKSWLTFFGIWLAEGWATTERIGFAIDKKRVTDALKKCVKLLNFEYTIDSDGKKLNIYDEQLIGYMHPFSVGAINKEMPEWVWELNKEQSQHFLESMCLGDGHMNGNTPMYDTSSIKLKDGVMRLALHAGWAANCYIKSPKGTHKTIHGKDSVTNADHWRITIIKTQLEPAVNKHIKGQQTEIKYKGKVYCFTVPNHIVYVRRIDPNDEKSSQKPVWSGQSARHGQKGTIGKLVPAIDMPWNSDGIAPDIIVNSLAFPSRMTIAMLLELLSGKVIISSSPLHKIEVTEALSKNSHNPKDTKKEKYKTKEMSEAFASSFLSPTDPTCIDATPFRNTSTGESRIDIIRQEMAKYGFDCGDEIMTDGITGKRLRCLIFEGPVFYQKLKHFVIDKVHGRARGGRTTLMRQPKEKIFCLIFQQL